MAEELMYDHRLRLKDSIRVKKNELSLTELASKYGVSHGLVARVTRPLAMELMGDFWRVAEKQG